MNVVSFLHQKGGTGKSTLAVSSAMVLAKAGHGVLLLDTDYQGTSSEWGNRFGLKHGVETRSQVQPDLPKQVERFASRFDWIIIDGPPGLSEMSESIMHASQLVVIPVRPAMPDVWALPWLAAIITKLRKEGASTAPLVVFNQYNGEDLAPFRAELSGWNLPVHPTPLPMDAAFSAVFSGEALPPALSQQVLALFGGLE